MITDKIELVVLRNFISNKDFLRRAIPYVLPDYFSDAERKVFLKIAAHFARYGKAPGRDELAVELNSAADVTETEYQNAMTAIIPHVYAEATETLEWLMAATEKWCRERAIVNAVLKSVEIINGNGGDLTEDAIPGMMSDALAVSFDKSVGHDYIEDADPRHEYYTRKEDKIPFDLVAMNEATNGGLSRKTLSVVMGDTGGGKSLFLCHVAASALHAGRNVVYVTMEMAEEKIAERIDANLLNVPIHSLAEMPKDTYLSGVLKIAAATRGKLIVKEFPTGRANANHFRALLNEIAMKKTMTPDLLVVDYINICSSARLRGGGTGTYEYVKSIAEELRGLAVEFNVPLLSATQTNRAGFSSPDVGLENTAESFGLPATADFMFAIINDEMQPDKLTIKQLKNRYNDPHARGTFTLNVDRGKMRLTDDDGEKTLDTFVPVVHNAASRGNFDALIT